MTYSYLTIDSAGEGIYKEKGSKFLAFAYPVRTEQEIKAHIDHLKKNFFDARHHCFAWILGPEKKQVRAFDDGEPNHSAGDPILGQIRSRDLTNTLVVVVRYFGGTKLGVGGLISAYRTAADDSLNHCVIIEVEVKESFRLTYAYESTPDVMRLVKELDVTITNQTFGDVGSLEATIHLARKDELLQRIKLLEALRHAIKLEILA